MKKSPQTKKKTILRAILEKAKDFSFWKENKIDGHYLLTREELKVQFKLWLAKQKREWLEYYADVEVLVNCFVGQKDGLSSVANTDKDESGMSELDSLYALLKGTRDEHFFSTGIWKRREDEMETKLHKRLEAK